MITISLPILALAILIIGSAFLIFGYSLGRISLYHTVKHHQEQEIYYFKKLNGDK